MIIVDEDSEHYKKITHTKWKETLPAITEEDALYCEKQLIQFANKEKTQEDALKEINRYLLEKGLITINKS
jgi:hypothetical protein